MRTILVLAALLVGCGNPVSEAPAWVTDPFPCVADAIRCDDASGAAYTCDATEHHWKESGACSTLGAGNP